ncbi:type IV pilus biogenesis protein PilM [Citrobacter farmeri]|uniref:type IV pilus biogenesis protein PilM n=1 Tax=Citrobacter farmeri TaxID=67824 RepID=UPI0019007807|nr:type IV pilus biogenesis protein PilM [Citrobacter farmeri]MBJ9136047.1 type IV pilus biogenesis protein PilM [Citrobacter farmeri]
MGYAIVAIAMLMMLVTNSITSVDTSEQQTQQANAAAELLADDMLRTASMVNDWRYSHSLPEGGLSLSQFSFSPVPDTRIRAAISGGRLWVWTPEQPGLRSALNRLSSGSALVLSVTGGHLLMADGSDMNLSLPAGVSEGNIVYLN